MLDLARRHQSKQSPCRLRGGRRGSLKSLIIEPVTGRVLPPTPVGILDRHQPGDGLADNSVLVIHTDGIEGAQRGPGAVNIVKSPAAVPRPLRQLGSAQKIYPGSNRLAACRGLPE